MIEFSLIPTPKELGFFLHLTFYISQRRKFTFPLSQFPRYNDEISSQNSITETPYFLKNFDL